MQIEYQFYTSEIDNENIVYIYLIIQPVYAIYTNINATPESKREPSANTQLTTLTL